jgi:hypothetical protein
METGAERELIDRLAITCMRLDNRLLSRAIYQGLITSADSIYHLGRIRSERYLCTPRGRDAPPAYEVQIEDEIMKPLISGTDAKRYIEPIADTFILFPYQIDHNGVRLISADDMENLYPLAWAHLRSWEAHLRSRENGAFNDEHWWRFGRHQNIDKQNIVKLIVPRLVASVSCSIDHRGTSYLDNVDVGGVSPAHGVSASYLAGIVNAPVANFVFRRISKPFRGDYRSANKQFIAPLPVPKASNAERADIATRADQLQTLHTQRRDLLLQISRRTAVVTARSRPYGWLFPDLPAMADLDAAAPQQLDQAGRQAWARERWNEALRLRLERLSEMLRPGVSMDACFNDGELRLSIDGVTAIERVFLGDDEGRFALAQWKLIASDFAITDGTTGKRLADALRKVAMTAPGPLRTQIIDRQVELSAVETEIAAAENDMNQRVYELYGLTPDEIRLVEAG